MITPVTLPTDGYEDRLCAELSARREKRLAANIHGYTPRTNNASALAFCTLQMWFARMRSQDKKQWDTHTQATVEDGRDEEKRVIAHLMEEGWEIEAGQVQVDVKDANGRVILTGRIDGKIRYEGHKIPFEIKRVQPYLFLAIQKKGLEALSQSWYAKRYLYQVMVYLYSHNEPRGVLICSDGLGHRVFVPVALDLDLMERILTLCESVEDAVSENSQPDPLPSFDPDLCARCNFLHICPVQRSSTEAEIITDGELVELLERRDATNEARKEYEAADERIKALVAEHPQLVVAGKWLITGGWKERKVGAKEARVDRFWQSKISAIGSEAGNES